jgi:hypothetical protein
MNTNFREWKSMITFLVLNPFVLSSATSASMFSTAKQMWFIPSFVRIGQWLGLPVSQELDFRSSGRVL